MASSARLYGCGDCERLSGQLTPSKPAWPPEGYLHTTAGLSADHTVDFDACVKCGLCVRRAVRRRLSTSMRRTNSPLKVALISRTHLPIEKKLSGLRTTTTSSRALSSGADLRIGPDRRSPYPSSDGVTPSRVRHCATRDNGVGKPYCSRFCCMSLKHAHQIIEKIPARCPISSTWTFRSFGKM